MATYSAAHTQAAPLTGTLISQLRAPTEVALVRAVQVTLTSAVVLSVVLLRSTTVGATFTSVVPETLTIGGEAASARAATGPTTEVVWQFEEFGGHAL